MTDPNQTWALPTMPRSFSTAPTVPTPPAATTAPTTAPTTATTTAPTTDTTAVTPTSTAMLDSTPAIAMDANTLPGGWQVDPSKVNDFANAVAQVRADLNTVFSQVNQLTSPSYQPQLGTSPCGQALTAKFLDRLSGSDGLLSNLNAVLTNLDGFVSNAQQSAAQYQEADSSAADTLRTT